MTGARRGRGLLAASMVAALVLSACGGGGDGDRRDAAPDGIDRSGLGAAGSAKDPDREGPVEIDGAREGGTVRVLSADGLNSMDPSEAYFLNTLSILGGLVTRSLTQYTYDEETGDMVLVPDLATDLGTSNADYTEWTFTIRGGVKWENGREVTAEDVRYGILRSFDRSTFPGGAAYSNDYFLDGDKYKGPYRSGTGYAGVVVDGNRLTLKMERPFPDLPYWAAFPAMGPVPAGEDAPETYLRHPWATGPYMFDDYVPEKSLTLVRNPHWDPATDPARTQYPDRYEFAFQVPATQVDQVLLNDQGDGERTLTYDDVLAENFRTFQDEHPDRLELGPQPCTTYWAPDYRKVTDKRVRQALAYAYPYRDAALAAGQIENVTRVWGENLMPPGIPGRTEYSLLDTAPGETDPAAARRLLEEADAVGYEIRWLFRGDDPLDVATKDVVVRALRDVGFTPRPVATTVADYSTERRDPDSEVNLRAAGWCSDWPSGGSWIPPVLESSDLDEEGLGSNYAAFSEPDVDRRIREVVMLPTEQQPAAWNDLGRHVAETYFPLFVIGYGGVAHAHGSKVMGHRVDGTLGMPTYKTIWLDD